MMLTGIILALHQKYDFYAFLIIKLIQNTNMTVRKGKLLVLCCFFVIAVALVMPASADIKSFKTDKTFYKKGDKIIFSGTVEDEDMGEFVTIVVEDPAANFVTLRQGFITFDKTFTVTIDTKEEFVSHGVYNSTGFVENKTNSKWVTFDFSLDGSPVIHPTPEPAPTQQPTSSQQQTQPSQTQQTSLTQQPNEEEFVTDNEEKTIQEKIKERIEAAKKQKEAQANPAPQTGSESTVDQTTTGESTTTNDTTVTGDKPTSGISTPIDLGSNLLYVVLGLGGAGAITGVVYGIKNKNRHSRGNLPVVKIREPSERPLVPSEDDYAMMILKNRLAKGEITIDEFNALKDALRES